MDHRDFAAEIAPAAAAIYGQDWDGIDFFTRQRWIDAVRDARPNTGQTAMEIACGQAIANWHALQAQQAAASTVQRAQADEELAPKGKPKK